MMMYLAGIGIHDAILCGSRPGTRGSGPTFEYDGLRYIGSFAPLFVHQYSQAWFDFRGKRDKYADYFQNSVIATDVHRRFCLELARQFPDYSDDLWGITASDSQKGYVIWGGPPATGPIDGTVAPSAAAGSLPFLAAGRYASAAQHQESLRQRLEPLRIRERLQSVKELVRRRRDRNRYRNHHVDGRECPHRICLGDIYEKPEAKRGMQRAGFQAYQSPGTPRLATSGSLNIRPWHSRILHAASEHSAPAFHAIEAL